MAISPKAAALMRENDKLRKCIRGANRGRYEALKERDDSRAELDAERDKRERYREACNDAWALMWPLRAYVNDGGKKRFGWDEAETAALLSRVEKWFNDHGETAQEPTDEHR